jgi:hypothetical protein
MPPSFDQFVPLRKGKKVRNLVDVFYTCINLIKYERVVQELQHLIRQYEIGKIDLLLSRFVNQVSRKRSTSKELHLSAKI